VFTVLGVIKDLITLLFWRQGLFSHGMMSKL
jgi:hypothetical protein